MPFPAEKLGVRLRYTIDENDCPSTVFAAAGNAAVGTSCREWRDNMSQATIGGGLAMLAIAIIMFVAGLPRHRQVVGFLRNRDSMQALYMMVIVSLLALGSIVTLSNL
jgi:hypothetical protein